MASLTTLLTRQFVRWARRALGTPLGKDRLGAPHRPRLGVEILESRDVFSVNPIVTENLLPGTPQPVWDVPGAGDPTIQGYATQMSVDVGQTINFKINDTALAPYKIDVYRVGYYQNNGARLVDTVPSAQTLDVAQPAPLFNPATALVDAGNWSVTASWAVPATAVSGVYFARVQRTDTGGAFMILFVVRNDASNSQVLFVTSDSTWEAYNTWGGYSLYQYTNNVTGAPGGAGLNQGPGPGYQGSAYQVSYNRPLIDRGTPGGLGDSNSFFYDEFPMVTFLEQNGYDVSYATDVDVDSTPQLELSHQVVTFTGHDEYWSANQFDNTMNARDQGVNLVFATGNEIFWKTYYTNSIDATADPERTIDCHKETHQGGITDAVNPGIWTGTWEDPTFDAVTDPHQPQNQLTGQLFEINRGPNDVGIPITVPYSYSQNQIWRNTSVAQLQPGQTATLGDFELGYESDVDADNGFRPAGEIDISATPQQATQMMIDYGNNFVAGSAVSSMTLYRATSGALVFGAGTVQFDWALSGWHDDGTTALLSQGDTVVVPDLQQMLVNLLADMNVQPRTLMAGLVYTAAPLNTTPPTSRITSPTAGQSVQSGVAVTITGTAASGGIVAGVEVSTDGGLTWHPAAGTTSWSYTWVPSIAGPVKILSRATDDDLNTETPSAGMAVTVTYRPTPTTGLVAAYSFNQSSGTTVADASGNGNTGTVTAGTWVGGGMFGGKALSFNGSNTWVTVPNSASLGLTSGMTLEAWVKPASVANVGSLIMKEASGGMSYDLYAVNDGPLPPVTGVNLSGTVNAVSSQSMLSPGVWYNLAATYDGSNLDLYVNGDLAASIGGAGNITTSSGALRIGGNSIWGEFFSGLVNDVRVYNIALNEAEIRSDMSTPVGGTPETTAPSVSLTAPGNGATVSGTTVLTATAADAVGVVQVEFFLNGQPLAAPLTGAPYTLNWNTLTVPNGTYQITAEAFNGVGLSATTTALTVVVDNPPVTTPPTVRITGPAGATAASGQMVLSAVASGVLSVTGVQFDLNGTPIGSALSTAPYRTTVDFSTIPSGRYSLVAVATDLDGNTGTSAPVTITVDHSAPSVVGTSPAGNATGVATDSPVSITFSKDINPSTITFTLADPQGNTVPLVLDYDQTTHTATFNHQSIALNPLTTYTATLSAASDTAGNPLAAPYTFTFGTAAAVTDASLFSPSSVPAVASTADQNSVDVGVKFRSDVAGFISGIRFYKGGLNTGAHTGQLWSSTGQLLASAAFTNETATGWQLVLFATPVPIAANTTYVASYLAPGGEYASTPAYFATGGVNSGPLQAPDNADAGGNGVYVYTTSPAGAFPTNSFNATNYWVDVVFNSSTANSPPIVSSETPQPGSTSINPEASLAVTFNKAVQANTISFTLTAPGGQSVPGTVTYDGSTNTATFTPTNGLAVSTTYTATVGGATDLSGDVMAQPFSWSFTTANSTAPPTILNVTPGNGTTAVDKNTVATAAFSEPVEDATISFVLKDVGGNIVPGTLTYNDETLVATLTPNAALIAGATYTATVGGAENLSGAAMTAPVSWSFTVALSSTTESFWSEKATPQVSSAADSAAIEVGLRWTPAVSGTVSGIMFYKGASNTGTHVGHLWDSAGNLLGTVTFTNETASGWQAAQFATPISVTAGATYVVSYYAPNGGYSFTSNYLTSPLTVGDLTAPGGTNGVFVYGTGGGFPTNSYQSANYWVDVLFTATTNTNAPVVTAESPVPGATGVPSGTTVSATFSQNMQPGTIVFSVTGPNGSTVPGTVSYNPSTQVVTFTPTSALAASTTYTATVSGAENTSGVPLAAPVAWSFTTSSGTSSYTFWGPTAAPAVASANDPLAVELGMKFYSDSAGLITGAEFYKGPANTGTHVVHLWDAQGDLLATGTPASETASGWQTVAFASPVQIQAGTTYVISYYAPNGEYSVTDGYFASAGVDAGPLHAYSNAAGGGQGVYRYGTAGGFPTSTYDSSNYWVQPVFTVSNSSTPPALTTQFPSSGATQVPVSTQISATFNEPVQGTTISFVVTDPKGNVVTGTVAYNPTTQTVTFSPTAPLSNLTTYTVTVGGAQNLSGVAMQGPVTWTFTTLPAQNVLTTTNFAGGTLNGTELTPGGALQLSSSGFVDPFAGSTLNSQNWATTKWQANSAVTVSNDLVSVQGAQILSTQTVTTQAAEGMVSFAANTYQTFGLATGLTKPEGYYWAVFATGSTTNTLYAMVNDTGNVQTMSLGAIPTGFHDYEIQPTASGYNFYLDGTLVTTIALTFPSGTPLHIAISSFNDATTPAIQAEWVQVVNAVGSGTYTSAVLDAGTSVAWGQVNFAALLPAGSSLTISLQIGTPQSNGTIFWTTTVAAITNGQQLVDQSGNAIQGEYLQYTVSMTTTTSSLTPQLDEISFSYAGG